MKINFQPLRNQICNTVWDKILIFLIFKMLNSISELRNKIPWMPLYNNRWIDFEKRVKNPVKRHFYTAIRYQVELYSISGDTAEE